MKRLAKVKLYNNEEQIRCLESKVYLVAYEIKEAYHQVLDKRETYAINNIIENSRAFYAYVRSYSSIRSGIR